VACTGPAARTPAYGPKAADTYIKTRGDEPTQTEFDTRGQQLLRSLVNRLSVLGFWPTGRRGRLAPGPVCHDSRNRAACPFP